MRIFKWFKQKEKCRHFKRAGEQWPVNMIELVRFGPYDIDTIGYGINECTVCKKRAFSCPGGVHIMPNWHSAIIDSFIEHKINWDAFKIFLNKDMAWYREIGI